MTPGASYIVFNVTATAPAAVSVTVFDGTTAVAMAATQTRNVTGKSNRALLNITIPSPRLWWPAGSGGAPFLYNATVSVCGSGANGMTCDVVGTYFGLRTVSISSFAKVSQAATPMTGPQSGIDRAGGDLAGSPFTLASANPALCWSVCNATVACVAWAFAIPGCDAFTVPTCWLKGAHAGPTMNVCRVSGDQGVAAGPVAYGGRPTINGRFTFLAGWLDQSYTPDGLYAFASSAAEEWDVAAVTNFGYNSVRLHQKLNTDRWYYNADVRGIVIMQVGVRPALSNGSRDMSARGSLVRRDLRRSMPLTHPTHL